MVENSFLEKQQDADYPGRVRRPEEGDLIAVYVYGAGGHAKVVIDVLRAQNITVLDMFDDDLSVKHDLGLRAKPGIVASGVASFEKLGSPIIIGIGDNRIRSRIAEQLLGPYGTAVHPSALVAADVEIGAGTVILHGGMVQASTKLGKHVLINTGAQVDHDNLIGDFCHISPSATLCGYVEVGEGTHVGAGATVIPGVRIGRWCTIGAGSVVIGDVPDYATVVGNPARIIKRRHISYLHGRRGLPEADTDISRNVDKVDKLEKRLPSAESFERFDLMFVGGGLSSTFTLMNLLESFVQDPPPKKLKILVADDSDSFFSGLPYSARSGSYSLLITSLVEFLPDPEISKFKKWLSANARRLLADMQPCDGEATQKWISDNQDRVLSGDVDSVFLPRNWFGQFLFSRVTALIDEVKVHGRVEVTTRQAEVLNIEQRTRTDSMSGYNVSMSTSSSHIDTQQRVVFSQRVVVAIGAPPVASQFKKITPEKLSSPSLLIDNLYEPGLDQNMESVRTYISNRIAKDKTAKIHCLLIGANASSMEFLYHLRDIEAAKAVVKVTVISPSAKLPQSIRVDSIANDMVYEPRFVNALGAESVVIADDILEAVKLDVEAANAQGVPFRTSFPTIWRHVDAMLRQLSKPEKLRFAAHHGVEIGRLQRRMGPEHAEVVEAMRAEGRLSLVPGKFVGAIAKDQETDGGLTVELEQNGEIGELKEPVEMIINCGPVEEVNQQTSSTLLRNMLANGLVVANKSRRGVAVNSRMEAENDLYFIGPTLAGNIVDNVIVWHAEHCGRLLTLSGKLADTIRYSLANNYVADIPDLIQESDFR